MSDNPANSLKDEVMWNHLRDGGQVASPDQLEKRVYEMITMMTQKTAGQKEYARPGHISFDLMDMVKWGIVCEAMSTVLDKRWPIVKRFLNETDPEKGIDFDKWLEDKQWHKMSGETEQLKFWEEPQETQK